jgi:hypothetical protein
MYYVFLCILEYKVDRLSTKIADNADALAASTHKRMLMQWEAAMESEFRSEERSDVCRHERRSRWGPKGSEL